MNTDWAQLISTLGFPIISAIALFFGCRYLLETAQKNTDRIFEMYDKANERNREAIEACTRAIDKLCEKLDKGV